ncbi:SNF2 domain-containing protein CLASSY 3-like [Primulina huaijiensis]|uniref:SNF2 domain-containing protein CLASSY 3-like n=1 Tax=Primulina huaijiensis TaxID=1492673 RepID=UPI003CC70810
MAPVTPSLSCVSRRTRSAWDSFYRNKHNEIKKKEGKRSDAIGNASTDVKHETSNQDVVYVGSSGDETFVNNEIQRSSNVSVDSEGSENSESESSSHEDDHNLDEDYKVGSYYQSVSMTKKASSGTKILGRPAKKKARLPNEPDLIEKLVECIWDGRDSREEKPVSVAENDSSKETLPLKFRFEDDEPCLPEKSDWEAEIDSLFCDASSAPIKLGRPAKKKARLANEPDLMEKLVDCIWDERGSHEEKPDSVVENELSKETLPLKFRFEDDEPCLPKKSDWETEIDSLFCDLEMGLWESGDGSTDISKADKDDSICQEIDKSPAAQCGRGKHNVYLDDEIGIRCKYCSDVILEIKYVLPPFYVEHVEKRGKKGNESKDDSVIDDIELHGTSSGNLDCGIHLKNTVMELIPQGAEEMYPHQIEGFKVMWRNIAGDTDIKRLERLPAESGRGCIISHAPGTGKTRLTIVFIQTFLKLYPTCCPVIIAPRGMLITWEQEFKKWKVDLPFHNMNETKLSTLETSMAANVVGHTVDHKTSRDFIRLVKLFSWKKGGSVLGISYQLFEKLAGEHEKKRGNEQFRKILLEMPGLLVLDEGHTPRNSQSLMWKALTKVTTQRRIILSGTPFQNNFSELYNTLCLVNPGFSSQIKRRIGKLTRKTRRGDTAKGEWEYLLSSISKKSRAEDELKKIQSMIHPFVHVHKGCILQETLPGLRHSLILLKPTDMQTSLLQNVARINKFLEQDYMVSLISVHPSLVSKYPEFSNFRRKLERRKTDPNSGAKTQFVIELIRLAAVLKEKVLIFCQYIDPLLHIQHLLETHLSWIEGREVIYMDGKLDEMQRQFSINRFNEKCSSAKVMLASQRACAEGISLVGASRVVLLDVVWNPSFERQAISRAYRLGQEKIVYVYHLVTSVEMKKYARQVTKDRISEMIFSGNVGDASSRDTIMEDKVLDTMVSRESFSRIIERIVPQPKESDLVDTFDFVHLQQTF